MKAASRRPSLNKLLVLATSTALCIAVLLVLWIAVLAVLRDVKTRQSGSMQVKTPSLRGVATSVSPSSRLAASLARMLPALAGSQNLTVPLWCRLVPNEHQGVACQSTTLECKCSEWCNAMLPESQQLNPECCGCTRGSQIHVPPDQDGTQNGTAPAWCQFIPVDYESEACHGSSSHCKCSDWCSTTPLWSQSWSPECCGCRGSHPRQFPPSLPHDVEARNSTAPGCNCSDWCSSSPLLSWQWNPECCGCEDGSPPPSYNGTQQGMLPTWCQFVPSDYKTEACHGTSPGCKCSEWCSATPLVSRQWNPECCGCSRS
mmetsp:Transcript_48351/g.121796  ORF Transcript_48351/g.121796 Transcript_48351/m.121796 type:complete len:316 (+) Transcript_48351:48-995(+)